jgi:aldehyde:ferredoxin oxidoreductase
VKGYFNRLLRIDLSRREYRSEEVSDSILASCLGGKGLGVHYLAAENPPGIDPFSPESIFSIAVGPITGTRMWSQSRFAVFAKSPASGGFGESYCGGSIAPKIKGCGVDVILLQGRAANLIYLVVDEHGVAFVDAPELKGEETFAAEKQILRKAPPNSGVMVIGPAGENRVACACIKANRWRSLGRGGMGAVLGAKNVKGIAFAGKLKTEIADEDQLQQIIRGISQRGKESPVSEVYQKFGTISQVGVTNGQKCFPTRYWQDGYFEGWEKLCAEYMHEHFEIKRHGCPNCFLQCTKKSVVKEGRHAGLEIEGPEYETIYALGGLNCVESLEEVAYLNDLCDRLGLDTISAGNLAAFAIEAHKRSRTAFAIEYNQPHRLAELFFAIARREGLGDVLADGIKPAAEALYLEDLAVHVKGLEPAGFDPRVLKGMGLSYATAARGACHLRGTFYRAELSGEMPKEQIEGKAELQIDYEDRAAIFDCLILCRFFRDFINWETLGDIVAATTGMSHSKDALQKLANCVTLATRAYNTREGLGPDSDTLPPFILERPNTDGARITRQELQTMVREYNQIRKERDDQE